MVGPGVVRGTVHGQVGRRVSCTIGGFVVAVGIGVGQEGMNMGGCTSTGGGLATMGGRFVAISSCGEMAIMGCDDGTNVGAAKGAFIGKVCDGSCA